MDDAALEIDVAPAERQWLAAAHPGCQGERGDRTNRPPTQTFQQILDVVDNRDFTRRDAQWADERRCVLLHQVPLSGVAECTMQDAMDVSDRTRGEAPTVAAALTKQLC